MRHACSEVTRQSTDFIEGELSFPVRFRIRLHLGLCGNCTRLVRQMRLVRGALQLLSDEDAQRA